MEILDVINEKDEVIGKASHEKVHKEKLRHRIVAAMVRNSDGEVLIQLRSETKTAYPLHWSLSIGGHVKHAETYEEGLIREGKEELDISFSHADCIFQGEGDFVEHSKAQVHYRVYEILYDGPIEAHNEEVEAVQFVDFPTLKKMLEDESEKIQPVMREVLQKFWSKDLLS